MIVQIGRLSGPSTDNAVESEFQPEQIDLIADVLAMVNKASGENWYYRIDGGSYVVPRIIKLSEDAWCDEGE